jgi:hypothetical protein
MGPSMGGQSTKRKSAALGPCPTVCGVSGRTSEGFEMQMGVNRLEHALLCRLKPSTCMRQDETYSDQVHKIPKP